MQAQEAQERTKARVEDSEQRAALFERLSHYLACSAKIASTAFETLSPEELKANAGLVSRERNHLVKSVIPAHEKAGDPDLALRLRDLVAPLGILHATLQRASGGGGFSTRDQQYFDLAQDSLLVALIRVENSVELLTGRRPDFLKMLDGRTGTEVLRRAALPASSISR